MHYVTDAEYLGGYRLRLRFEDQTSKLVDLDPHLDGGVFEPLRDPDYFRQFRRERDLDTIVWPNGADFCPDFLYAIGEDAGAVPGNVPPAASLRHASGGPERTKAMGRWSGRSATSGAALSTAAAAAAAHQNAASNPHGPQRTADAGNGVRAVRRRIAVG